MDEFAVREYGPETCATLAMRGPFDQMPAAFGTVYGWLQSQRHVAHGMPVAVYLDDPATVAPTDARWEIRAPVEDDARECGPDSAGLAIRRIPAMRVATTVHKGPYDGVGSAYGRLTTWIAAHGLEIVGPPMEAYLNDPGQTRPEEYLTEIMIPVADASGAMS